MAKKETTYSFPQDSQPAMASEPAVAYAVQRPQNHIVMAVPRDAEQTFRKALDKWLDHTGIYSGPNLCWDNEPFRQIQSMGAHAVTMIDRAYKTLPDYTHRHLGWLKRKLTEV